MKRPREIFTGLLKAELAAAGLTWDDLNCPEWGRPIRCAVRNAMECSPVLFTTDAVSSWLGMRQNTLQKKIYKANG